jgi:hypothetical protein
MKTTILISLATLSFSLSLKSQILLENLYTNKSSFKIANLTQSGYKYYMLDVTNQQIVIYNTNHSVFNTITIPTVTNYTCTNVFELSDNLFNSDNLMEYCASFKASSTINDYSAVISENGTTLLNCGLRTDPSVFNIGGNIYKLQTVRVIGGTYKDSVRIYSLPGSKPCDACGGPTSIVKNNSTTSTMPNAYPNPTSTQITIPYTLTNGDTKGKLNIYDINGKALREFSVDNAFDSIILDTQEFSAGTYYYNLTTNSGVSNAKKIIVIK